MNGVFILICSALVLQRVHTWSVTYRAYGRSILAGSLAMLSMSISTTKIYLLLFAVGALGFTPYFAHAYDPPIEITAALYGGAVLMILDLALPPMVLYLSASRELDLKILNEIERACVPGRVIHMTNPAVHWRSPLVDADRLRAVHRSSLRLVIEDRWQDSIRKLLELSPLVVIDGRASSPSVLEETRWALAGPNRRKLMFVTLNNLDSPLLRALLAEADASSQESYDDVISESMAVPRRHIASCVSSVKTQLRNA